MFAFSPAARLPIWVVAGLQLACLPAHGGPDVTDPKADVPRALYASPLRGYRPFAEPALAPWRETNDTVRQRGGWRAYAREAGGPAPAAAASQPAAAGHGTH